MAHDKKIYIVTDGCMWEVNKGLDNEHPHSMEVVDLETGAVRYIRSGSRISFLSGQITDIRTQEVYNQKAEELSRAAKDKLHGATGKTKSKDGK